jgi:chromosome segregation ATPase
VALFTYPSQSINTTGLATESKQDDIIQELQGVNTELDTQSSTLSNLDSKVTAVDTTGKATEAKQDSQITELQAVNTELDGQTTLLTSIDGKDFATETTLDALNTKVTAVDTTGKSTEAKQDTMITSLSAIESDIDNLNARLAGNLVPELFDYLELTYVAAGNGTGEIETVVYKTGGAAGTTVATLTLGYDGSNRLSSVTRS